MEGRSGVEGAAAGGRANRGWKRGVGLADDGQAHYRKKKDERSDTG